MVRLSLVNLYLHGFTDPHIAEYDTLTSEDNWNEHADIILANPPFMSPKGGIKPHKRFGCGSIGSLTKAIHIGSLGDMQAKFLRSFSGITIQEKNMSGFSRSWAVEG